MKTQLFSLLLVTVTCLTTLTLAWSKEDHELFRVRDELNLLEGTDNISFYSFLGVKPSASLDEINKQNKKRSRQLHPDKAIPALVAARSAPPPRDASKSSKKKPGVTVTPGPTQKERAAIVKEANDRYALYSVVVGILRDPEQRERYDHFLRNGFPTWRGTGYLFKRYRPGLGTVLVGLLLVFGGAAHYGALYVGYQRQRRFVEKYVTKARSAAWGSAGIPGVQLGQATEVPPQPQGNDDEDGPMLMNRRQKRAMEKDSRKKNDSPARRPVRSARDRNIGTPPNEPLTGPAVTKKRVMAENGKVLIVDSTGNVYLEETTEEGDTQEFLLDPAEIPLPTIFQTALFRLPIYLYKQSVGRAVDRFRGTSGSENEPIFDDEGAVMVEAAVSEDEDGAIAAATAVNANEESRMRRAKAKNGGGR